MKLFCWWRTCTNAKVVQKFELTKRNAKKLSTYNLHLLCRQVSLTCQGRRRVIYIINYLYIIYIIIYIIYR